LIRLARIGRKKLSKRIVSIIIMLLASTLMLGIRPMPTEAAESPAIVYPPVALLELSPTNYYLASNSLFDVNVWLLGADGGNLSGFWDVAGFDFKVTYNSSLITGINATIDPKGWFASFWPGGFFIVENSTYPSGYAWIAFLGLLPSPEGVHTAVNGTGIIASIHFKVHTSVRATMSFNIVNATIAGFPHPERHYPPWNATTEVFVPFQVRNLTMHPMGDVNDDGVVNILDIVAISLIYGCKKGDPNWNPYADLDNDGKIDILDLVTCAAYFGQTQS
jgi:hypothetical protein